jgi:gliding motility-associated-like protein
LRRFLPESDRAGDYYAAITDVNGYSMNTDSIIINVPPAIPPSIQISSTATDVSICTPIDFTATPSNTLNPPSFQWEVSGVPVGSNTLNYSNNIFANGDQVYCIMASNNGCVTVKDTSNTISLVIDPQGHASVTIDASGNGICGASSISFTAKVTNGSNAPVFKWFLNGNDTGDSSDVYTGSSFANGDVVYCLITSDASCGLAKSNSIPVILYPVPVIDSGQVFSIPIGQSLTLEPVIMGDIASYLWNPPTGLSDPKIRNPVAQPTSDIVYMLTVVSTEGCEDSASIKVNGYTPLRIPSAFSPNGDGKNDILYILGGPEGSRILDFTVFNRWGQKIFQDRDGIPGDRAFGWNGKFQGSPAPSGTYVYFVHMRFSGGNTHLYKGTVVLVR